MEIKNLKSVFKVKNRNGQEKEIEIEGEIEDIVDAITVMDFTFLR